jgi:3-dehydroquinate synthase
MVAASNLAVSLGLLSSGDRDRIVRLIGRAGLPVSGLTENVDELVRVMAFDKKVAASKIRFILPDRIGHVIIRDDVGPETMREAFETLR